MVALTQLWVPIILSAVFVFLASSLVHMVFKWHNSDDRRLPDEDAVRAAILRPHPGPGSTSCPTAPT